MCVCVCVSACFVTVWFRVVPFHRGFFVSAVNVFSVEGLFRSISIGIGTRLVCGCASGATTMYALLESDRLVVLSSCVF